MISGCATSVNQNGQLVLVVDEVTVDAVNCQYRIQSGVEALSVLPVLSSGDGALLGAEIFGCMAVAWVFKMAARSIWSTQNEVD